MSYNTRRSGNMGNQPPPASAVGQRRPPPVVTNNFVPGGQLNLNNQGNTYPAGNQQRQQQQQQQQTFVGGQQQQQRPPQAIQQQFQQQQKPVVQQQFQPPPPQQQPQQQLQQPLPQQQQQQQQQQQPEPKVAQPEQKIVPSENATNNQKPPADQQLPAAENADGVEKKPKPFWLKNAGKITRKEKMRRRNKRLVKFLQPKNAVMVLNEMVGTSTYTLSENNDHLGDGMQFKASVLVDGIEHFGCGKSKMAAKSAAAETALRYLVLKRLKAGGQTTNTIIGKVESGEDVNMEEEGTDEPTLPWQHVASFALHKLFSTWDDGSKITERLVTTVTATTTTDGPPAVIEKKPAKKMPPNPEQMNPIMLLNQMVPHAEYIELSKAGNPPNIVFTYKCSANGQSFIGRGSNKKQAKKMCAYEACRTLLNVEYPPESFAPYPAERALQIP